MCGLFQNPRAAGTSKMSSWRPPPDAGSQEGKDVPRKPLCPSGTPSTQHSSIIALFFPCVWTQIQNHSQLRFLSSSPFRLPGRGGIAGSFKGWAHHSEGRSRESTLQEWRLGMFGDTGCRLLCCLTMGAGQGWKRGWTKAEWHGDGRRRKGKAAVSRKNHREREARWGRSLPGVSLPLHLRMPGAEPRKEAQAYLLGCGNNRSSGN